LIVFDGCESTWNVAAHLAMPSRAVCVVTEFLRYPGAEMKTEASGDMITILRLLQHVARVRSRTMGDAELEVVWLLTFATFVAVGIELLSLTFAVNIGRILNSKDHIRAVRTSKRTNQRARSSPKRVAPRADTVAFPSPASTAFDRTVLQTGTRLTSIFGMRKGRQQDDPLPLATA
jgi:hypothetical protein